MEPKRKYAIRNHTWFAVSLFFLVGNLVSFASCYIPVEYDLSGVGSTETENELPGLRKVKHTREKKSNFSGSYHGEFYTSYASPSIERLANTVDMDQMLSYETAWTNGKRVTTFVKVKNSQKSNRVHDDLFHMDYGGNNDQHSVLDSYATVSKTYAHSQLSSSNNFKESYNQYGFKKRRRRRRREVYGRDDRFYIPASTFGQREPFSYSVRISTGCTGILVSPRHVLTAAHCVHDQSDYVDGFQDLKVGFVKGQGVIDWVPVKNVRISKGWIEGGREAGPFFDYALLKLRRDHRKPYINMTVSQGDSYRNGERIYFTSFEDDKPSNTLWYRSCVIEEQDNNFLYHFCDAQPGSSGSGVYAWSYDTKLGSWKRYVIGVFSGNRWKIYDDWFLRPKQFNVAVRITPSKYVQICKWLGLYGERECHLSSSTGLFFG